MRAKRRRRAEKEKSRASDGLSSSRKFKAWESTGFHPWKEYG